MEDIDIWRTAKLLIETHGDEAAMQAAMRADEALDNGEMAAMNVWRKVMRSVEELQRTGPKPGEQSH
jgi:hypothetical protein